MATSTNVREGYLVIADISGYTRFVTTTELEHAQSIIGELTELMIHALAPPLTFVKPEGDAVFCYADGCIFPDGEHLLELIEVCYLQFAGRRREMAAATTCSCAACSAIDTLDLKFVCHYGTFMLQPVRGVEDLAGPDVILVHRLLKNSIADRTGSRGYAFFTDACRAHLPSAFALSAHSEDLESIGQVSGGVHDLRGVLKGERTGAGEYVGADEADFECVIQVPAPSAVVWQYNVDPAKRSQWQVGLKGERYEPNVQGRMGVGAIGHCDHGSWQATHRYIDWRPFRYFTSEDAPAKSSFFALPAGKSTMEFRQREDGGTDLIWRLRLADRGLVLRAKLRAMSPVVRRMMAKSGEHLTELIERDGLIANR